MTSIVSLEPLSVRIQSSSTLQKQEKLDSLSPLWELDDETFKQQFQTLCFPVEFPLDSTFALIGGEGRDCFGINTSIKIAGLWPHQVKKTLRIAALFLNASKTGSPNYSAESIVASLSQSSKIWDISEEEVLIVKHLIQSRGIFNQFFHPGNSVSYSGLKRTSNDAFAAFQSERGAPKLVESDFRKLLFCLFLVEAGALPYFNREKAHLFRPLCENMETMNFDKFIEISHVKSTIEREKEELPNFSTLSATLYRGAQPMEEGCSRLGELGVRTMISFRAENTMDEIARQQGIEVLAFPLDAGKPQMFTDEVILNFLKAALDPANHPAFICCTYGADRTGFMSASFRYVAEKCSLEEAIQELTRFQSSESENLHPPLIERLQRLDVDKLRMQLGLNEV